MTVEPTLRVEHELLHGGVTALACVDEVGRGALSGPVTVGVVVITSETMAPPPGVRDSKLLSAVRRDQLEPLIRAWAAGSAVGHASASEIDDVGITAAMRRAAHRALSALSVAPDTVLLDGRHDYLTSRGQGDLFEGDEDHVVVPRVVTMVKADLQCAGVAAASILAKTERDRIMAELHTEHPAYGWAGNKGYGAPDHLAALTRLGPTPHHRVSWRLPSPG